MFVAELFEAARPLKQLVIIPGGFHPFHAGHFSLYQAARRAFPKADIYVASTNDTSERPFPFTLKQELAALAGVPADHFVQVKSPFQAKEITSGYNPETTELIFVRSTKDRDEKPTPGGTKKDGTAAYLQPLVRNPAPMNQHGYMAYLPTVEFQAGTTGVTSASQIRAMWPKSDPNTKAQIIADLYPRIANNAKAVNNVVAKLDQVMGSVQEDLGALLPMVAAGANAYWLYKQLQKKKNKSKDEEALQESLKSKIAGLGIAAAMALGGPTAALAQSNGQLLTQALGAGLIGMHTYNNLKNFTSADMQAELNQELKNVVNGNSNASRLSQIATQQQNRADQRSGNVTQMTGYGNITYGPDGRPTNEDAAGVGVIASKKQAKDPRYMMSLTKDVRPGQTDKNLKAFRLK